MANKIDNL